MFRSVLMAFSIGMLSAKPVYCYTVSMAFDRAGYRYVSFAVNLLIENAIRNSLFKQKNLLK